MMKSEDTLAMTGCTTQPLVFTSILLLAFGWILTGESLEAKDSGAIKQDKGMEKVATIGDQAVTQAQLEVAATDQLDQLDIKRLQMMTQLEQERQKVLHDALEKIIENRLLKMEAKARGVSKDDLVKQEITSRVPEITDEDVHAFYRELSKQRQGLLPEERLAPQIRPHLQQQKEHKVREAFIDQLKEKYHVEMLLSEPRVEVATVGFPARGPANAPVTMVEFSDFECPFCSRVVPTIEKIKQTYGDKVRLVFRQFPLQIHPHAAKAAEASLCAREQNKFWEMHDAMFGDQHNLSVDQLKAKAKSIGLDTAQFDQCLDNGKYADAVKSDIKAGMIAGVSGTPAVFINGRFVNGAQPYETFTKIVDEELAEADKTGNG
jgi:protein-disulfide isomerase